MARPVHLIITMIKWNRTSRLSTKNSFCRPVRTRAEDGGDRDGFAPDRLVQGYRERERERERERKREREADR